MKDNCLRHIDKKNFAKIKAIGDLADKENVDAYLVGGMVRDVLLKRKNLDLDVVVEGDAIGLARKYTKAGKIIVHERFKTATVQQRDYCVDFATARKETYSSPGALPDVQEGSIGDDLFRRDFTINAMAARINHGRFGNLVDLFGGLKDLKGEKIRVMHDRSFVDDPTRILRAVRFEQRFGFLIEAETLKLLKAAVKAEVFQTVTPDRCFNEFKKILKEEDPYSCLRRLINLNALGFFPVRPFSELTAVESVAYGLPELQGKSYVKGDEKWWLIYFMASVSRQNPQNLTKIVKHFNLMAEDRKELLNSLDVTEVDRVLMRKNLKPSDVYTALKGLGRNVVLYLRLISKSELTHKYVDLYFKTYSRVKVDIDGNDLKKLGITDGLKIGKILERLLIQKMNGDIKSRRQQIAAAKRLNLVIS